MRVTNDALEDMVPKYAVEKAKHQLLVIQGDLSIVDITIQALRHANAAELIEASKSRFNCATKASESLDNLIEEAVGYRLTVSG